MSQSVRIKCTCICIGSTPHPGPQWQMKVCTNSLFKMSWSWWWLLLGGGTCYWEFTPPKTNECPAKRYYWKLGYIFQALNFSRDMLVFESHLKMDGWKTTFLLGWPTFRGHVHFQGFPFEARFVLLHITCGPWIATNSRAGLPIGRFPGRPIPYRGVPKCWKVC